MVRLAASVFSTGIRSVWEVKGGGVLVGLGSSARPLSRTVQWVGTKQHNRELLDWPGSARVLRPAEVKSTATVYTRELAFLRAQVEENLD